VYVVDFLDGVRPASRPLMERSVPCSDKQIIPNRTNRLSDQGAFIGVRWGPDFLEYFPNTQFPKMGSTNFQKTYPWVMDDENAIVDALTALLERIVGHPGLPLSIRTIRLPHGH